MKTRKYSIVKVANIISILREDYPVKTWFVSDFTERKLTNAMRKLEKEAAERDMVAFFERNF